MILPRSSGMQKKVDADFFLSIFLSPSLSLSSSLSSSLCLSLLSDLSNLCYLLSSLYVICLLSISLSISLLTGHHEKMMLHQDGVTCLTERLNDGDATSAGDFTTTLAGDSTISGDSTVVIPPLHATQSWAVWPQALPLLLPHPPPVPLPPLRAKWLHGQDIIAQPAHQVGVTTCFMLVTPPQYASCWCNHHNAS